MKRTARLILFFFLITSAFISGFTYRDWDARDGLHRAVASLRLLPGHLASVVETTIIKPGDNLSPVDTYGRVFAYLDSNYYGNTPEPKKLTHSAIRGMLSSLGDRYTRYLDPDEYDRMQQDNRGDFQGIGAVLDVKDGRIIIKEPLAGSPAERAGLKQGDVILKVDDHLIQGMDIEEVVKRIRGDRGTKVKLTIVREELPEPFDVEIIREIVSLQAVEKSIKDEECKIGYIALRQFNEKSDDQLHNALDELERNGMRALILDLRGNPGGLLDVAVDIGSRFIRKGNIVIIRNKGGQETPLSVEESQHENKIYPLVVLIDGSSASASEILAGAIQDHKAGTIIGTDSFGKGLVQTIITIQEGALAITTAKYLTPNGQDVNKHKIHPDIVVEPTDEDLKNEKDVQLDRAVQFLRERLGANQASSTDGKRSKS